MSSLLIQNGTIMDETGAEGFRADLLIRDDRIAAIGQIKTEADRTIHADGRIVCPGFIDIHRHCDAKFLLDPAFGSAELAQGITTCVVGNCGMSLTPSPKDPIHSEEMYQFMEPVLGSRCGSLGLSRFPDYLDRMDSLAFPLNTASMIGTGSVRITVKGFSDSPYTAEEMKKASALIEEALRAGAAGVSMGIMYIPECYSSTGEFAELLKPVGRLGGVVTAHIRGEGDSLVASVREIIEIGAMADCPVEISHFKSCGIKNWRRDIHEAIRLIEQARSKGQDVTCDFYPYEGGSTALTTMLPPAFVNGNLTEAIRRLGTSEGVEAFRKASCALYDDWDNYCVTLGWDRILISGTVNPQNRGFLGMTVAEAAKQFGFADAAACAAYLMHDEAGKTAIINMSMCQDDIDTIAKLPYSLVISDAIYADTDTPHPRMYGAFPKIIREYVNERNVLSLPKAIQKMTSMPAERMGISERGVLREGSYADVLVFDPKRLRDHATFTAPARPASGLDLAIINGKTAWENGIRTNHQCGRNLRILH